MSLATLKNKYQTAILDGMARTLWVHAYVDWADAHATCEYCNAAIHKGDGETWVDENGSEACDLAEDYDAEGHSPESDDSRPGPGGDWDEVAPATPPAAYLAADDLTKLLLLAEGLRKEKHGLVDLFELAMTVDRGEPFELTEDAPPVKELAIHRYPQASRTVIKNIKESEELGHRLVSAGSASFRCTLCNVSAFLDDSIGERVGPGSNKLLRGCRAAPLEMAEAFGSGLANMALGSGSSWFDDHKEKNIVRSAGDHTSAGSEIRLTLAAPRFEVTYDDSELAWNGVERGTPPAAEKREAGRRAGQLRAAYEGAGEVTTHGDLGEIKVLNENDRSWTKHSYVISLGVYGYNRFLVYANSVDDALDEVVDWAADNAPGLLSTAYVNEEFNRLKVEKEKELGRDLDEEEMGEIQDEATSNLTPAGEHGDYVNEWSIVAEDPTTNDLLELAKLKQNPGGEYFEVTWPGGKGRYPAAHLKAFLGTLERAGIPKSRIQTRAVRSATKNPRRNPGSPSRIEIKRLTSRPSSDYEISSWTDDRRSPRVRVVPGDQINEAVLGVLPPGFHLGGASFATMKPLVIRRGFPTGRVEMRDLFVVRPSELAARGTLADEIRPDALASVARARADGTRLMPIEVDVSPDGALYLYDGNHRVQWAHEHGDQEVLAVFHRGRRTPHGRRTLADRLASAAKQNPCSGHRSKMRNPPANMAPGMNNTSRIDRVLTTLARRDPSVLCFKGCPGWAVFETDYRGLEIQACDECNSIARAEGDPVVTDDDVLLLPEANLALMRAVDIDDTDEEDED